MNSRVLPLKIEGRSFEAQVVRHLGKDYAAITPICAALGIEEYRQIEKLKKTPQFNPLHMSGVGADGKKRQMACLPIEEVGSWLSGINANKTKPEVRDILISFQRWCQVELHAAIQGNAGIEVVSKLERAVEALTIMVLQQGEIIKHQGNVISELSKRLDGNISTLSRNDASLAGYHLSLQRKSKELRH